MFERELFKILRKSDFIFVFKPSLFYQHYYDKQKEPRVNYQSLFKLTKYVSNFSFFNDLSPDKF